MPCWTVPSSGTGSPGPTMGNSGSSRGPEPRQRPRAVSALRPSARLRPSRPLPSRSCRVPHGEAWRLGEAGSAASNAGRNAARAPLNGAAPWDGQRIPASRPSLEAAEQSPLPAPPTPPEGSPTPALTRPWRRRCRFSRTALTDGRPRRAPFSPLAARDGGGRNGARSLADPAQRCLPAHGATAQAWGARRRAPHPLKGTGVQHGAGPEPRDGRTEGLPKPRAVTAATGGRKGAARPRAAGAAEISSAAKPAGGRQAADLRFRHPAAYKPTDVGSRHPPRGLAAGWCCATLVSSLL